MSVSKSKKPKHTLPLEKLTGVVAVNENVTIVGDNPKYSKIINGVQNQPRISPHTAEAPGRNLIRVDEGHVIGADDDQKISKSQFAWVRQNNSFLISPKPNVEELVPGLYDVCASEQRGLYLEKKSAILDELFITKDETVNKILDDLETFWASKAKYEDYGLTYKRGVLLYGPPGTGKCHTKGTRIMMYDGTVKNVEDIVAGDKLMGDDSTPRTVLSLATGEEECFNIKPRKFGEAFGVNKSHIMVFHISPDGDHEAKIIEMSINEYLKQNKTFKHHTKLLRTKVNFKIKEDHQIIDPYFLGLWIGDGLWDKPVIFVEKSDICILEFLDEYASSLGMSVSISQDVQSDKLLKVYLTKQIDTIKPLSGTKSVLHQAMYELGIIHKDKLLPHDILTSSVGYRQRIIAGYIDSDGHKMGNGCYEITSKRPESLKQIEFICRSLGYTTRMVDKTITPNGKSKVVGYKDQYHYKRLYISNAYDIPCLIKKKLSTKKQIKKNGNVEAFDIIPLGIQTYYGFEIDGNHRYLLADTTITHNTSLINLLIERVISQYNGIALNMDTLSYFIPMVQNIRALEPTKPILAVIEDLDDFLNNNSIKNFLNLLDGNLQVDNIVYLASTNYMERIEDRVKNRPSRFDRRYEIGYPTPEDREFYFRRKMKDSDVTALGDGGMMKWINDSKNFTFAHMKEMIASIIVMGSDYEEVISQLKSMNADSYVAMGESRGRNHVDAPMPKSSY